MIGYGKVAKMVNLIILGIIAEISDGNHQIWIDFHWNWLVGLSFFICIFFSHR